MWRHLVHAKALQSKGSVPRADMGKRRIQDSVKQMTYTTATCFYTLCVNSHKRCVCSERGLCGYEQRVTLCVPAVCITVRAGECLCPHMTCTVSLLTGSGGSLISSRPASLLLFLSHSELTHKAQEMPLPLVVLGTHLWFSGSEYFIFSHRQQGCVIC